MSQERIEELFGEMSGEDISDVFTYNTVSFPDFECLEKQIVKNPYNKSHMGLFIVKHKPSGEIYGLAEYRLDSWDDGSSTAWDYGYTIYALTEEQVTVTQYKINSPAIDITPKDNW